VKQLSIAAAAALALGVGAASGLAGSARDRVQVDVSRAAGVQSEATIALDPSNDRVLLAASNSDRGWRTYTYSSTNGGATWTREDPVLPPGAESAGDPIVAIDRHGRQYSGFLVQFGSGRAARLNLFVAARAGAGLPWSPPAAVRPAPNELDDKPTIAVDTSPLSPHADRIYVAWNRIDRFGTAIELSYSDDGGATWSEPTQVSDDNGVATSYPSLAVARDGTLYATWWSPLGDGVFVDRSLDGGATFGRDRRIDPIHPALRPLFLRRRVNPPDGRVRSDEFWPTSAVDASTGYLWVCFYDTRGDRHRRRAFFSCTRSVDGGRSFALPVRAATVPSNETLRGADSKRSSGAQREYGDYEGLAVGNRIAHPVWTDTRRLRTLREEIYTTTLSDPSFRRR
jgi:hypothetical protein